ncbi:MAG: beta-lactamase family protein [Brevefilum sp.]|nr:beta-lactamase family protein [Brevefilum sp.]
MDRKLFLTQHTGWFLGFILTIFCLIAVKPNIVAATSVTSMDFAVLDAIVEEQMKKHDLPGVAIAIIDGGQVVYSQGYGRAGRNRPMTPQTQMLIGSQSKSFTALAVAQLADQGVLELDAPVQSYIPWFTVADDVASKTITIRQLLNHSSGLSDAGFPMVLSNETSLEEAVKALEKAAITAPVGSTFQYFNMGYSVLAYLVEVSSGQSYADYIQVHILTPLQMDNSTADPASAQEISQGYSRLFGFAIPMAQPVPAYGIGAGYIVSTADDLAKYALRMINYGDGLVSSTMARKIFYPSRGDYGFGWFVVDGGAKIFHGGANETFRTDVNLYPNQGRGFVLLINQGYQVDHFISAVQLRDSVEAFVLGRSPIPVDQGWSVRWVGWGIGVLVLGLSILHVHNFLGLRTWLERDKGMSKGKRIWDIGLSFLIPTVILVFVMIQVRGFYGDRFNLWPTLVSLRLVMPDVFILMLIGSLPDYVQGMIKIILWQKNKRQLETES